MPAYGRSRIQDIMVRRVAASFMFDDSQTSNPSKLLYDKTEYHDFFGKHGQTSGSQITDVLYKPPWAMGCLIHLVGGGGGGQIGHGGVGTSGRPGDGGASDLIPLVFEPGGSIIFDIYVGSGGRGETNNNWDENGGSSVVHVLREDTSFITSVSAGGGLRGNSAGRTHGSTSGYAPSQYWSSPFSTGSLYYHNVNNGGVATNKYGSNSGYGVGGGGGSGGYLGTYNNGAPGSGGFVRIQFYGFPGHFT